MGMGDMFSGVVTFKCECMGESDNHNMCVFGFEWLCT